MVAAEPALPRPPPAHRAPIRRFHGRRSLLLCLALAAPAAAQCTPIPGTGCSGALAPTCRGTAQIGTTLEVRCPNQGRAPLQFLALGPCLPTPASIFPPAVCTNRRCEVAFYTILSATVSTGFQPVRISIPNDSNLVNLTLCTQCADLEVLRPCFAISQAVSLTIQP